MTKVIVAFRNFANAPRNSIILHYNRLDVSLSLSLLYYLKSFVRLKRHIHDAEGGRTGVTTLETTLENRFDEYETCSQRFPLP
jgi:hypothetical protein